MTPPQEKQHWDELERVIDELKQGKKPKTKLDPILVDKLKNSINNTKKIQVDPQFQQKLLKKLQKKAKKSKAGGWFNLSRFMISLASLALVVIAVFSFNLFDPDRDEPIFTGAYALTNEEISQGADIVINLPSDISPEEAKSRVNFEPQISGEWVEATQDDQLIFRPEKTLDLGLYYEASLETEEGVYSSEFEIVEPPKILQILPEEDTEAAIDSEITIMFNRPMVPLTTIDIQEDFELPITLTPETEGDWRWISTRALQFVPKASLVPSANYEINIDSELRSEDGLKVNGLTHEFFTTPLRVNEVTQGEIIYNQPIRIVYNQEVDLEETQAEMTLKDLTLDQEIKLVAEYAKTNEDEEDRRIINILPERDSEGRFRLWDFEHNYSLAINKSYPASGDITLDQAIDTQVAVTNIVQDTRVESGRSYFIAEDYFDPEGQFIIQFHEAINLAQSRITADNLLELNYGEKCEQDEAEITYGEEAECPKVEDRQTVVLRFNSEDLEPGSTLEIELGKIVNDVGQQVNIKPINFSLELPPELAIAKIIPDGQNEASLTSMTICSTQPLIAPDRQVVTNYFQTTDPFIFKNWQRSKQIASAEENSVCSIGNFQTDISYNLNPLLDYQITLKLESVFGQSSEREVSFTTGGVQSESLNFVAAQGDYSIGLPQKTKLTYASYNMEFVDLHICELMSLDMINLRSSYVDVRVSPDDFQRNCIWETSTRLNLGNLYWKNNYFQVNLSDYLDPGRQEYGNYVLAFSHPDYQDGSGNQIYQRSYVTITDIGVVKKEVRLREGDYTKEISKLTNEQKKELKNSYWVVDLNTLEPLNDAQIELYIDNEAANNAGVSGEAVRMQKHKTIVTNESGIASTEPQANITGLIAKSGIRTAILLSSEDDTLLEKADTGFNQEKTYLYTDRPIYRPGDKVEIKGIYRWGYDGNYQIPQGKTLNLIAEDSRREEVINRQVELNEFGTFSESLILDQNAPLGTYRLKVDNFTQSFTVEEYEPAPFELKANLSQEEYIAGENLETEIEAKYYFGVPLEGGDFEYSLIAQDYYFDRYTQEFYNFGSQGYCYFDCDFNDQLLLKGKGKLQTDGTGSIRQKLDFERFFSEDSSSESKIFRLSITAKNTNGESVSVNKSFIVHRGEYYLGVRPESYFAPTEEEIGINAIVVDPTGSTSGEQELTLEINRVKWEYNRRQEVDGGYYYRWEKQSENVQSQTVETDSDGKWSGNISLSEIGEYELIFSSQDSLGNTIKTSQMIYIYDNEGALYDPELVRKNNNHELEVITKNDRLEVGETGSIIIKNPFEKAKALITLERGGIYSQEVVEINSALYNYEFTATEELVPNIYASVVLVSSDPAIRYGKVNFQVNNEAKELDLKIKPDHAQYLPGEEVFVDLEVRDNAGKPVSAELSVAVVDLSVLALKGNPEKNLLDFFYDEFSLTVETASNIKSILQEIEVKTGKGGGGGEDLASQHRGEFRDTAFWKAKVTTDETGKAQVNFTIPDNLTTWRIEVIGVDKETNLAAEYTNFLTQKPVMIEPLKPRFVVPGDEFKLGAKLFNQSGKAQDFSLSLEDTELEILTEQTKTIALDQNEYQTVYFTVKAPVNFTQKEHQFTFKAQNTSDSELAQDSVSQQIAVTQNSTSETVATAGSSSEPRAIEFIYIPEGTDTDRGYLQINTSATLVKFVDKGLESLLAFPYSCTEQIVSKLEAIAALENALAIDNIDEQFELDTVVIDEQSYPLSEGVERGLARIYESQKLDGGFGYYPDWRWESDFYLTLRTVNALLTLEAAGYSIEEGIINKANQYLDKALEQETVDSTPENLIYTALVFQRASYAGIDKILPDIRELVTNQQFLAEEATNSLLVNLAILTTRLDLNQQTTTQIMDLLENKVRFDARGAHLPAANNWQYHETTRKNTALLLEAIAAVGEENELTANLLRWLLNSRSGDGGWGSTSDTLHAIRAFTSFLAWQNENEANFDLQIFYNDEEKANFTFNGDNFMDKKAVRIEPLENLETGSLSTIKFNKTDNSENKDNFYYDIALKYFIEATDLKAKDHGITIKRDYYAIDDLDHKNPISSAQTGEVLRGKITLIIPEERNFLAIEDFLPAGLELVNLDLATENQNLRAQEPTESDCLGPDCNLPRPEAALKSQILRPKFEELRDDRLFLFTDQVTPGVYEYTYFVRALVPGKFQHLPAVASELYFPEVFGRTAGRIFEVNE
jgi:uncharacterized protein YfaS (alpha-2-macroglobulin family)